MLGTIDGEAVGAVAGSGEDPDVGAAVGAGAGSGTEADVGSDVGAARGAGRGPKVGGGAGGSTREGVGSDGKVDPGPTVGGWAGDTSGIPVTRVGMPMGVSRGIAVGMTTKPGTGGSVGALVIVGAGKVVG